jgi:hypothetical protein
MCSVSIAWSPESVKAQRGVTITTFFTVVFQTMVYYRLVISDLEDKKWHEEL